MYSARQTTEVSAYYPLIVSKDKQSPWISEADACFVPAQALVEKNALMEPLANADRASLSHCVQLQRLAFKAADAADDETLAKQCLLRLIYLAALLDGPSRETHLQILQNRANSGSGMQAALFQLEEELNIARIITLFHQNGKLVPEDIQFVLDHYRPVAQLKEAVSEYNYGAKAREPIGALQWMLLAYLEKADDPSVLETARDLILDGKIWESWLVERIGAIAYTAFQKRAQKDQTAAERLETLDRVIPQSFKILAEQMHLKPKPAPVTLGPYRFTGVPDEEISAWKATLEGKKTQIATCLTPRDTFENAFFIVKQPLNGTSFGRERMGTIIDPIQEFRMRQPLTPAEIQCILKVFAKLPSMPALDGTQSVEFGLTISLDN